MRQKLEEFDELATEYWDSQGTPTALSSKQAYEAEPTLPSSRDRARKTLGRALRPQDPRG
ncbi:MULTISPECIES: hypothetical protein [Streptomyces]|uniref:hypothetical protein n=1 Tax=Streptomyces TaxID=1883 RepID=UPI002E17930B|nr:MULTISPECIES: hypothetical protein [unclassified Streptomyces]